MFGLPVLVLSPFAGRIVDRRGPFAFIVLGMVLPAVTGIPYTFIVGPGRWRCRSSSIEATGFALLNPALYAVGGARGERVVRLGAPSVIPLEQTQTGVLAVEDILYPFYLFSAVMVVTLVLGVVIGGERLRKRPAVAGAASALRGAAAWRRATGS